jgi:hypothetical protein
MHELEIEKGMPVSDQSLRRRSNVMKKGRNTAEILDDDGTLDDIELWEGEVRERTLVVKAQPPSRKVHLIAHGVQEIRCAWCGQIRPIAGAEDSEEGWICEDCLPAMFPEPRFGGQRGR